MKSKSLFSFIVTLFLIYGCSSNRQADGKSNILAKNDINIRGDFQNYFDSCGVEGTIAIYDIRNDKWIVSDTVGLEIETLPASTFKIINLLIALETNTIKDENEIIKWVGSTDTVKYGYRPEIYHDMPVKEAFELSAGWVFVELAFVDDNNFKKYNMKPITAITVFFSLMIPSLFLSYGNYTTAKEHIIDDVNQALAQTILYKQSDRITADTLKVYRSKLKIDQLKKTSYLAMCTEETSNVSFCSDTMTYKCGEERLHVRAYPNCSKAAVFSMSEQTVPSMLFIVSVLWGMFSMFYLNHKKSIYPSLQSDNQSIVFGDIVFSDSRSLFYNGNNEEIHFTPMQYAFMKILITSECKKVPINEICQKLWPGKDNSKETLYTLVRRLKPVVESNSNVRIISDKGGYYSLKIEN